MRVLAVRPVGNNWSYLASLELGAPMTGIISFVGEQITGCGQVIGEHHRTGNIGSLAGRQVESQRAALFVTYGVNLGVAASFCQAYGLNRSPPFPPPAQRWTLIWEASIEICSGVPDKAAVSSANIYCQIPFCDQRL